MRLLFLCFVILSANFVHSQELELHGSPNSFPVYHEDYPDWVFVSSDALQPKIVQNFANQNSLIAAQFESIAIECFRERFCTEITRPIPKDEPFINNRFFSVNKHTAARFSWDVLSCAFVQAMRGKEIDQVWYPAFTQVVTNMVTRKVSRGLTHVIPKNKQSKHWILEFIKDHSRQYLAQEIVGATKSYVLPAFARQSLALLKTIFAKFKM